MEKDKLLMNRRHVLKTLALGNVIGANLNDCLFKFKPHRMLAEPYGLVWLHFKVF